MEIRKDFKEVSPHIASLLNFSKQFLSYDNDWVHYKNREDFDSIFQFSNNDKQEVEELYASGRDMASYMAEMLAKINDDFSRFPNLTSVVNFFDKSWVYGNYDINVSDRAVEICQSYNKELWSVSKMSLLFKEQENILSAVRKSLDILKRTNLYKLENGIEVMNNDRTTVNVTGNSSSSINVNSDRSNAAVSQSYVATTTVFSNMVDAINSTSLENITKEELIKSIESLESSYQKGSFTDGYKNFMQNVSAHMTVFLPSIPHLTALL